MSPRTLQRQTYRDLSERHLADPSLTLGKVADAMVVGVVRT